MPSVTTQLTDVCVAFPAGPIFSANDRTFTTTCSPTSPRDSFSEDVDNFDKVRLKVTALRGTCTPTLVRTATAEVALAPYLNINIDDESLEVCETDTTVDVVFGYIAKHGTVDSNTFTATPVGICNVQALGEAQGYAILHTWLMFACNMRMLSWLCRNQSEIHMTAVLIICHNQQCSDTCS